MGGRMFLYQYVARITGGTPDSQPDEARVPEDLKKARQLWKTKYSSANQLTRRNQEIYRLILPFLRVNFIPDNLNDEGRNLMGEKGENEYPAESFIIQDATFDRGPLPTLCATATFNLPLKESFASTKAFDEWQKKNRSLTWGVVFEYVLGEADENFYPLFTYRDLEGELVLPGSMLSKRELQ